MQKKKNSMHDFRENSLQEKEIVKEFTLKPESTMIKKSSVFSNNKLTAPFWSPNNNHSSSQSTRQGFFQSRLE